MLVQETGKGWEVSCLGEPNPLRLRTVHSQACETGRQSRLRKGGKPTGWVCGWEWNGGLQEVRVIEAEQEESVRSGVGEGRMVLRRSMPHCGGFLRCLLKSRVNSRAARSYGKACPLSSPSPPLVLRHCFCPVISRSFEHGGAGSVCLVLKAFECYPPAALPCSP